MFQVLFILNYIMSFAELRRYVQQSTGASPWNIVAYLFRPLLIIFFRSCSRLLLFSLFDKVASGFELVERRQL